MPVEEDDEHKVIEEIPEEFGTRTPKKMQDPKVPRQEKIDERNKLHLPYRSWCRHCVRGRGRAVAHEKAKEEHATPEVHFDCLFMRKEGEAGKTLPVAAVKERASGMLMASVVPRKTTGVYVSNRIKKYGQNDFLKWFL